ncbi:uncharacterized protein ARMOST_02860 [Armillaria ostoyae]|uniref:Uncharacterized protein n=1 Tax=Armillaria ostoyae TaxID=47428 RepID=A0A284QST8_ARMOS|nr:uncharacterized protein ARMOST_02860 [Armillaria ostoyae]
MGHLRQRQRPTAAKGNSHDACPADGSSGRRHLQFPRNQKRMYDHKVRRLHMLFGKEVWKVRESRSVKLTVPYQGDKIIMNTGLVNSAWQEGKTLDMLTTESLTFADFHTISQVLTPLCVHLNGEAGPTIVI